MGGTAGERRGLAVGGGVWGWFVALGRDSWAYKGGMT